MGPVDTERKVAKAMAIVRSARLCRGRMYHESERTEAQKVPYMIACSNGPIARSRTQADVEHGSRQVRAHEFVHENALERRPRKK